MARDLGKAVRMAMANAHKSGTQVAEGLNVTRQTVANWRENKGLTLDKLESLAEFCGLDFEEVLKYSE